jgi:hypothetical protein
VGGRGVGDMVEMGNLTPKCGDDRQHSEIQWARAWLWERSPESWAWAPSPPKCGTYMDYFIPLPFGSYKVGWEQDHSMARLQWFLHVAFTGPGAQCVLGNSTYYYQHRVWPVCHQEPFSYSFYVQKYVQSFSIKIVPNLFLHLNFSLGSSEWPTVMTTLLVLQRSNTPKWPQQGSLVDKINTFLFRVQ